jgi:hypothetical protein
MEPVLAPHKLEANPPVDGLSIMLILATNPLHINTATQAASSVAFYQS